MVTVHDLEGRQFGALVVVAVVGRHRAGRLWKVRCVCGVEKVYRADKLLAGRTVSCGASACRANAAAQRFKLVKVPRWRQRVRKQKGRA